MKPRSLAIIINDNNEILLIYRYKLGRDYWVFPGGSVENGESPEDAVVREVLEETNLNAVGITFEFDFINEGRYERYFSIENFSGELKLGLGPERLKNSKDNVYKPQWLNVERLTNTNLQPTFAKEKLLAMLESGFQGD